MSSMFLLIILFVGVNIVDLQILDETKLSEFERRLDHAGIDMIHKMYEDHARIETESSVKSDLRQITDESAHHRVRRSVILDQVKAARKTGNREALFLRSSIPYKRIQQVYDPTDIVPIALTLDPPFNTIEIPKFFAVANYRNPLGSYESGVMILRYNVTTDNFTVHQFLNEYAPYELESFTGKINPIAHKNFLSVSGYIENADPTSTRVPKVSVYEISSPPFFVFTKIQDFRQNTVRAMKYIEISQVTYLILGMYYQLTRFGRQYSSPSQLLLLRYDAGSNLFHFHASLPGSGVTDIECFTVRGKTYLAVANYRDNIGRLGILSFVYSYNEQIRSFEMMQYLSTYGARDIEHFTLANDEYLVVANEASGTVSNKTLDVESDVYKLSNGRFELIQKLSTVGAVKWKGIAVPNCKQDVLLVYSDQRNNVDQVGIYTFSHDKEMFGSNKFSIYHLDLLNSTFRPQARALSAYSLQDKDTGVSSLYLIVGASDTSEGNTIYKLTYEIVLTDSPLDAFKRNVAVKLKDLKESLDAVKALLAKAKATLKDAVTSTGNETVTGRKVIMGDLVANHAVINTLNIKEGTMVHLKGNESHGADQFASPITTVNDLKVKIEEHNETINGMQMQNSDFMYLSVDQNVSTYVTFKELHTRNMTVHKNITVLSNVVNNMNLTDLNDIVLRDENTTVTGTKIFVNSIQAKNVDVKGKVNGLSFSTDLVMHGSRQNITALKVFVTSINATALNADKINKIDTNDILYINRPGFLNGTILFPSGFKTKNVSIDIVNGLDMNSIYNDRVTKTSKQNIAGYKIFDEIISNGDVSINGTINGIDIADLKRELESKANISTIHGKKIFTDNITVTDNVFVESGINDGTFPDNVLLKSVPQTIIGEKLFAGKLTFANINVQGEVSGVNMSDVVTLDTDQEIQGHLTFEHVSLTSDINFRENNTVNGIDLSEFVKDIVSTTEPESLNHLRFRDLVIVNDLSTPNMINNESLASFRELWNTCLHNTGDQNITRILVTNNITVTGNLSARFINGFSYPEDFATVTGNQTFEGNVTFVDDVIVENLQVNGTVNGINFNMFNENIVTDGGVVFGDKTINGNVVVKGTLNSTGKINGLDFSQDLLFYSTEQNITARKHFNILNLTSTETRVVGDIYVVTTIDGVDLSELELSGMTVSKNETITGTKCFSQADYNRSLEYVNGIDLSALRDDIVTTNTDQVIRSKKTFKRLTLQKNLNTTSTIDGIDVSELAKQIVMSNENSIVTGEVTFSKPLSVNGSLNAGKIDGFNMDNITSDLIFKTDPVTIDELTVIGSVSTDVLNVSTTNSVSMDDIVYRSKEQVVSGIKEFVNVTIESLHAGLINEVNISALKDEVVFKSGNQTILGEKVFMENVEVMSNLNSSGKVNGVDLRNWDIALKTGSQFISGKKTFVGDTTIKDMTVKGVVNQENMTSFVDDVVLSHGNYTLENVEFERGIDMKGDMLVTGNMSVLGLMNSVNLTKFDGEVLKTVGEQTLTGKYIRGFVDANKTEVLGFVNGLKLGEDLVTKGTSQRINGLKEFDSMKFVENVLVKKLVSGVNMSDLATNTLFKHSNNTQIISGRKSLRNVTMDDVTAHGLVDGLNVTTSEFVTLHTKQVVTGGISFTGDFVSNQMTVAGNIDGVNLMNLNNSRVLLSGDQTISSDIEFSDNVVVDKNISITGKVNHVDISEFNESSPFINETELGGIQASLTATLSNQCRSLTYVKESLQASAYHFDYFVERKTIPGTAISHATSFAIENNTYLALSVSGKKASDCTKSIIKHWNSTQLNDYQTIHTSGAAKMVFFRAPWNVSYLLVVNSKSGCPSKEGPSELYRWNTTISKFQLLTPIPTSNTVDAVVHTEDNYVIIFLSNFNDTLSSWLLTSSNIAPYSTLDRNPVALHTFRVSNMVYLAVATRTDRSSSHGNIKVYKLSKGNMTMVQSIPTKGASSITSFKANGVTYLVVANDRAFSASGLSTYHLTVDIFRYSAKDAFEWFRSIPTYRAYRVSTFDIGSITYLAIVHFDRSVSFYQFGIELGFEKIDELHLTGVRDVTYMEAMKKRYVFISSAGEIPPSTSKLLELNPSGPDQKKVSQTITCS